MIPFSPLPLTTAGRQPNHRSFAVLEMGDMDTVVFAPQFEYCHLLLPRNAHETS